jgi:hypothetical protein
MGAFTLPLTLDKRMTPTPVGCQGDWDWRPGDCAGGAFCWVCFLWSLIFCLDGLCERVAVKMGVDRRKK